MGVNDGRADLFVPKQFLDSSNIVTVLKQMGSEAMAGRQG
jgi:hypothetical protein